MMNRFSLTFVLLSTAFVVVAQNSAPSSHFVFDDRFDGDIVINEVRVPKSGEAMYTYYEALGWRGRAAGYAGIQAHPRGHIYIFSIWDHKEHITPIRAVHRGAGTLTEKFGGEGTGLKSWNFELGWETDTWYTLVSRAWPIGEHTFYGYWVHSGKTGQWTHLVTMDVAAKEAFFKGSTDAFIEDWLNTGSKPRTTNLRGGWKRKLDGQWHAFGGGRYSVNRWDLVPGKRSFNFKTNWDGGVASDDDGSFYFMTAGGRDTKPSAANPSRHSIKRKGTKPKYEAIKLKSAKLGLAKRGKLVVTWETDSQTLPQFGFKITGHDNPSGQGEPLFQLESVEPHARRAEFPMQEALGQAQVFVRIHCLDILDNESPILSLNLDDVQGRPVILYITSKGFESGPMNDPRTWTLAHWNSGKWRLRKITTSDNNYDMGSLYIDNSNWQIYGPTETGPQPYNPGGEMALWESRNNGETWKKTKQLTRHSKRNHTYARAPVNAHPDFYALWADGHGRQPSESNLYFCNRVGRVYLLPRRMSEQFAKPTPVEPDASANAIKANR